MSANSPQEAIPQVLAEIQAGGGLTLSAAGRMFPAHRGEGTINPSTIFRWVTKGSRTSDGRLVKLEAARVGGRWLTSKGAIARLIATLTDAATPTPPPSPPPVIRTPAARAQAAERAVAKLRSMGA